MQRLQGTKNRRNRETPSGHSRRRKSEFAFCGKVDACEGLTADAPHLPNELADSESWQAYKRGAVNDFPFIWEFDLVSDLFAALP